MTPNLKAKELVEKYRTNIIIADRYSFNLEDDELQIAKQCALIAVDEIIKVSVENSFWDKIGIIASDYKQREYWDKVKTEIELL